MWRISYKLLIEREKQKSIDYQRIHPEGKPDIVRVKDQLNQEVIDARI